jgi:hypothetical protein
MPVEGRVLSAGQAPDLAAQETAVAVPRPIDGGDPVADQSYVAVHAVLGDGTARPRPSNRWSTGRIIV